MIVGLKPRLTLAAASLLIGGAAVAWTARDLHLGAAAPAQTRPVSAPAAQTALPPAAMAGQAGASAPPTLAPLSGGAIAPPAPAAMAVGERCDGASYAADAVGNAISLGAPAPGAADWAAYAPLVGREIGSACPPASAGFAARLARWRAAHRIAPAGGQMDRATLAALTALWSARRPFVHASAGHVCPASPPETALAPARPEEGYGGKAVQLLPGALDGYRRMVADARAHLPAAAADARLFTLVSGWRGPAEEAARCADGSCDGRTKSSCSAHRTGTAVDLYLGGPAALGDRAAEARTPAYLWLVANAGRYGFVPYAYEPWHWEWTGAA